MTADSLRRKLILCALSAFALVANVIGQTPGTGAISGTVLDPSNRAVANAEVLTIDDVTHASRSASTTVDGIFRVPLLLPGSYSVIVKAAGFAEHTSRPISVIVSETSSLNVTLAVAGANASVEVISDAAVAELETSTQGGLVDETAIRALPLSTRNFTQILGLAPGVIVDLPNATALGHGTQNVASDGAAPTTNNIQFNGIDANNLQENSAADSESSLVGIAIPAPDSIEEFRVQTANFDAAYLRKRLNWVGLALQPAGVKRIILLSSCAVAALGIFPALRLRLSSEKTKIPIQRADTGGRDWRLSTIDPFLRRSLPAMALWTMVLTSFTPFANVYLSRNLHVPLLRIGLVFSAAQVDQFGVTLLSPVLFRVVGLVNGIVATQVATAGALLCLASTQNVRLAVPLYLALFGMQWMSSPGLYNVLMSKIPEAHHSEASSLTLFCNALVGAGSTACAGFLFARFGYGRRFTL